MVRASSAPAPKATFQQIFDAEATFVWRALAGLGLSDADVADASQQVFLVLFQKHAAWEPSCPIRTFLYGICLRVASDVRRKAYRRRETLVELPPEVAKPAGQEDALLRQEALNQLELVLGTLTPAQRSAFVLFEIDGHPMSEVARILDCPLPTAYARHQVARRAVTAAFTGEEKGFP